MRWRRLGMRAAAGTLLAGVLVLATAGPAEGEGGPLRATGVADAADAAAVAVAVAPAAAPSWEWPVPAAALARPFIASATPYGAGHRGIDIIAAPGTPVRAPADGIVGFAGVVVDRPLVSVQHPGGLLSSVEPVEPSVAAGEVVHRGQVIGMLVAGHCAAGCLHLGVRLDGDYVNPLLYLGGLPRSVLLPVRRG